MRLLSNAARIETIYQPSVNSGVIVFVQEVLTQYQAQIRHHFKRVRKRLARIPEAGFVPEAVSGSLVRSGEIVLSISSVRA